MFVTPSVNFNGVLTAEEEGDTGMWDIPVQQKNAGLAPPNSLRRRPGKKIPVEIGEKVRQELLQRNGRLKHKSKTLNMQLLPKFTSANQVADLQKRDQRQGAFGQSNYTSSTQQLNASPAYLHNFAAAENALIKAPLGSIGGADARLAAELKALQNKKTRQATQPEEISAASETEKPTPTTPTTTTTTTQPPAAKEETVSTASAECYYMENYHPQQKMYATTNSQQRQQYQDVTENGATLQQQQVFSVISSSGYATILHNSKRCPQHQHKIKFLSCFPVYRTPPPSAPNNALDNFAAHIAPTIIELTVPGQDQILVGVDAQLGIASWIPANSFSRNKLIVTSSGNVFPSTVSLPPTIAQVDIRFVDLVHAPPPTEDTPPTLMYSLCIESCCSLQVLESQATWQ
jgi:hypothetical protein